MPHTSRWLAALATGGVVTGGAAALGHAGPGNEPTASRTRPAMVALAPSGGDHTSLVSSADKEVRQLLTEAGGLQVDIASARATLARALAAQGAISKLPPTSVASTSTAVTDPSFVADSQRLAAQQAALTVERQQLANEAQQLAAEQAQLQREAAALAAVQQSTTTTQAPPVHTTTGATTASGSTDS